MIFLHFIEKPSKDDDYLDVDWVPNKNLGEYSKNWKKVEYFIRKKNASLVYFQTFIVKRSGSGQFTSTSNM